jgi:hypothetical protein
MFDENVFTLRGVVRALRAAFGVGEEASLSRSVRYWVAEGLLRPKGAVHTGRGRNRIFEPNEVLRAGILFECSKWSITVGTMKLIFDEIEKERRETNLIEFAHKIPDNQKITFCFTGAPAHCEIVRRGSFPPDNRSLLSIDVKRITKDLRL